MSTLWDLRRRVVAGLVLLPFFPFYFASRVILRLVARKSSLYGLTLYDISRARNENVHLEALRSGLQIMRDYAPWHFSRTVQDLGHVWIGTRSDELPRFESASGGLSLGSTFLLSESPNAIASMLVFVTTSARLYRRFGVARKDAMRRQRICLEAALAFARRLPDSEEIVQSYTRAWDNGFWNSDARRLRQKQELEERGMPRVALKFIDWLPR